VAVRINVEAFHDSIPATVQEAAARLRHDDGVGELEPVGGGVRAFVHDRQAVHQAWIGIVDQVFTGECDCPAQGEDLCAHAIAVALTAFAEDVALSGAATPPSVDPAQATYEQAVHRLSREQLTDLVVAQALRDQLFAARLLEEADIPDLP
jgi:uncharacterized Zn finger protein